MKITPTFTFVYYAYFLTFDIDILNMKKLLAYTLIVCVCFSCSKNSSSPSTNWDEYYPLSNGCVRTYECTSVKVDVPAGLYDSSVFFLRETIGGIVSKENSCTVYADYFEKSETPNGPWSPYLSQSVQKYSNAIVRVENNVPYQVLKFPAKYDYSWDLNLYNQEDEQLVFYDKIFSHDTIYTSTFDSVLVVLQKDFKSLYTWDYAEERYARNVGLIYRKNISVESQPNHARIDLSKPIEDRITKGTITTLQLVNSQIR